MAEVAVMLLAVLPTVVAVPVILLPETLSPGGSVALLNETARLVAEFADSACVTVSYS